MGAQLFAQRFAAIQRGREVFGLLGVVQDLECMGDGIELGADGLFVRLVQRRAAVDKDPDRVRVERDAEAVRARRVRRRGNEGVSPMVKGTTL